MKYTFSFLTVIFPLSFLWNPIYGQGAGNFVNYEKNASSLLIHGSSADLKIDAFTSDIFKVQVIKPSQTSFDSSYTVVLKPAGKIGNIVESAAALEVFFDKCSLIINKSPLQVGLKENNQLKIQEYKGFVQTADSVHLSFTINPKDVFHGGGANPEYWDGKYTYTNLNNQWFHLYEGFMVNPPPYPFFAPNFSIPYIVASQQYGLLIDSNLPNYIQTDVGFSDSTKIVIESPSNGRWAYYLINGDSNDEIISNYTLLTGRQALPPRWAFGYIQARSGYTNWHDAGVPIDLLHSGNFPIDAIEIDSSWYGGKTKMGNLDWNSTHWNNAAQMMANFSSSGVKTILSVNPYLSTTSSNFSSANNLCGIDKSTNQVYTFLDDTYKSDFAIFDFFKPAAQNWLGVNYKQLMNQGVTSWDLNFDMRSFPSSTALNFSAGSGSQIRNLFYLAWQKASYTQIQNAFPTKRQISFANSGWAGSQHTGVAIASGSDVQEVVNSGIAGAAYAYPLIQNTNAELEIRELQMAIFSPIVRSQSDNDFYFLSPLYRTIARNYLNVRYQLLPYIYTLAWQNSTTGRPFVLPMDYFSLNDNPPFTNNQYFFGEQLLVAPINIPGMFQRQIYFPSGQWFDFWNNNPTQTGGAIPFPFIQVSLNNIPVYAKAGSIIPMANSLISSTDYYKSDSLTIKYFQDVSVPTKTFTMYHDDGADPNVLTNQRFELIDFVGNTYKDSLSLLATQRQTFSGNITNRNIIAEFENFTSIPKSVTINNQNVPIVFTQTAFTGSNMAYFNLTAKQLQVRFDWKCVTPTKVVIQRDGLAVLTANEPTTIQNSLNVYPNPSTKNTAITIESTAEAGNYQLDILSMEGKNIFHANLGQYTKGEAIKYVWNSTNQSGIFIVQLQAGTKHVITKKIVIE